MVYPYNRIPFGNRMKSTTDICDNMNELWKQYATWEKPDTEVYRSLLSVWVSYYEMFRIGKSIEMESRFADGDGECGEGDGELGVTNEYEVSFEVIKPL